MIKIKLTGANPDIESVTWNVLESQEDVVGGETIVEIAEDDPDTLKDLEEECADYDVKMEILNE